MSADNKGDPLSRGNESGKSLNWRQRLRGIFGGQQGHSPASPVAAAEPAAQAGFERAAEHHRQGRLDEAEAAYRELLKTQPESAGVLLSLGVLQAQRQNLAEAAELMGLAAAADPGNVTAYMNRGNLLRALGRHQEALASYEQVLKINPGNVDALTNRGVVLLDLGQGEKALASYEAALTVVPGHREAGLRRCGLLKGWGRLEEAQAGYAQVLAAFPDDVAVLFSRGLVLAELDRIAEALASYDRALAIKPDYVEVLINRGIALTRLGRTTEALESYDRAVACNPGYAEAFNNRGALLADLGRYDAALEDYDRALAIKPDFPGFLDNRAGLFRLTGQHERAAKDYSRLLELIPGDGRALGYKLYANIQICKWDQHDADKKELTRHIMADANILPFTALLLSDSGEAHLRCARNYARRKYPAAAKPLWGGERYSHNRIRIAYLSADFHLHATAHLMAELFERHDRERFEVSAWSFGPETGDAMRARLRRAFEHFNDVRDASDDDVAAQLRAAEIDIAVDLKGYSKGCRPAIFARRVAPIQVNYLVYPGTTGADCMDYIIGDAEVIPEGQEALYSEQVVRLPDSYQVNDSKRGIAEHVPDRTEAGLPESGFVFCCFNNNYKITPAVFDVWMRLLKQVEGSVLWLLQDNAAASRNLRQETEVRGVDPGRLVFAPRRPPPDHLARHRLADLFLDTLPCNAHTTASDALWAGLPVLTCRGQHFAGRVAASLLRAIGLPELIVDDLAAYEALAHKLATTPALLAGIKTRLERNRTSYPLFDIDQYRRHLESAYVEMYQRYQRREPPQGFAVGRMS
jgi:predicted O-linked N-acetylglucosamine transferase (SPINDLY family)